MPNHDLHLVNNAASDIVVNAGVPVSSSLRSTDIDGDPLSGAPDIGADELVP